MKRIILSILTITVIATVMSAQKVKSPDFAYPKTVSSQSLVNLNTALSDGNTQKALRALIDYSIALQVQGQENTPLVIAKIDSVRTQSKNPVFTSLINTFEASLYSQVYSSGRWRFDHRNLPLLPLAKDCNEWSGLQFRMKITELIDSALTAENLLRKERISDYSGIISQNNQTRIYFPTLYDFVANNAIDIFRSMDNQYRPFLPYSLVFRTLRPGDTYVPPTLSNDPVGEKILNLYSSLVSPTSPYSAPSINAMIGRMEYILRHSVRPDADTAGDNIDAYIGLYKNLCDDSGRPRSEYVGDILADAPVEPSLYDYAKKFIAYYPEYWRINCLKNIISSLSEKSITVTVPTLIPAGKEIEMKVTANNTSEASIDIYDVSSLPVYQSDVNTRHNVLKTKIGSIPVSMESKDIPFKSETIVKFKFPRNGNYVVVPAIKGVPLSNNYFTKVHVSSIVLVPSRFTSRDIRTLNPADGAPLADVKLTLVNDAYNKNPQKTLLGTTDKNGILKIKSKENGMIIASLGDDRYTMPIYSYDYNYQNPDKWITGIQGYSSLPLYHPGDTAEWCAVCYEYKGGLRRVMAGKEISAVLYDANSMPIDTITGMTDNFGRLTGSFRLPEDGLTGRFNISVAQQWNTISFEVADYKLPTFMIETENVETGVPAPGEATLRGRVVTYSGFPMADTDVTMELSVQNRPVWWRYSSPYQFYSTTVTTDSYGRFSITLSDKVLSMSPVPDGFYTANISATSQAGETQTAKTTFSLGERYFISVENANNIDISQGPVSINAKVVDYRDSIITLPVNLSIFDKGKCVRSEVLRNPVNLTGLKPGRYTMAFSLDNPQLADTVKCEVVLFDPNAKESPVPEDLFWTPETEITLSSSNPGHLLYATGADSHLIMAICSGDSVISDRTINSPAGIHNLEIFLPEGIEHATLDILCTGDYRQTARRINIRRHNPDNSLRFITETFRNKVNPGESETWTFRIVATDGNGQEAAVITDLYNTAIDAIASWSWNFTKPYTYTPSWVWGTQPLSETTTSSLFQNISPLRCLNVSDASFDTYGMSLVPRLSGYKIRGASAMMRSSNSKMAATGNADGAVVEELAMDMGSAEGEVVADASESGSGDEAVETTDPHKEFAYRDSEVPLAFFRPSLTTDKDGHLSLTFTVPNANTTWGFRAVAFTDSLLTTSFSADIIASKPIMVQPNLPRFLRNGDNAVISASVMNNSGEPQSISTEVTIFNPSDNSTICSKSQTDTISAGKADIISVSISVPSDISFIGYRIKSTTGNHSDGEQSLIPILPSMTSLIETLPFFMSPERHEFETALPVIPDGGTLSLSFCENPAWYVVTALPGLLDRKADTAPTAALSLYSAAIATGLLRDNPAIAKALDAWLRSDKSDATLTSMLDRNEELKLLMLNATPWMQGAADDNERMTRLSLLFDKKLVNATLSANIATLKSLEGKDGGWYWSKHYPTASRWATYRVLSLLGRLNTLGFMPKDKVLSEMIDSALGWDNKEITSEFLNNPDADYTTYVRIHDYFKESSNIRARKNIVDASIQRILRSWKKSSLPTKAVYAEILCQNGHPRVAREILTSIREFASVTPDKGMWFPVLDNTWYDGLDKIGITAEILMTFSLIDPGCTDIDNLRQWLILQKGAQNWGSGQIASTAVAAILSTSDSWFVPSEGAKISVGKEQVIVNEPERLTGEIMAALPVSAGGKTLKIERKGNTPSWGAIFSRYTDDMTKTASKSCPELSIEKTVYEFDSSDNKSTVISTSTLKLGAKVRVTLTVNAETDMDYVTIVDDRPACFEPVDQLSGTIIADGLYFYRENRDSSTRIFIDHLPKGSYILTYDMWVNNAGTYTSGLASVQSQYAPQYAAHSSGSTIVVKN